MTSTSQSQSDASHLTSRRGNRFREDVNRKLQQEQRLEPTFNLLDPDNKAIIRTPLPLLKPAASKGVIKKGIVDRRTSQATDSVSHSRHSHSEDRSVSQMESSTSSHDNMSTSTPDDESTTMGVDDSSDSHSTPGDRSTSVADRNKSVASSDGHSTQDQYGRGGGAAANVPSAEKDLKDHDSARLAGYVQKEVKTKDLTLEERRLWLAQEVTITLTETPTIMLWSHQDEAVAKESTEEAKVVQKKNDRYQAFCEARAGGESGGKYQERGITTILNKPSRSARCGTQPPQMVNSGGIQVTTWKLYDEMLAANEEETEQEDTGLAGAVAGEDEAVAAGEGDAQEAEGGEDGDGEEGGGGTEGVKGKTSRSSAWMNSPSLLETVMVVERAVVGNVYEELQLAYRGIPMEKLSDFIGPEKEVSSPTTTNTRRNNLNLYSSPETEAEKQRAEEQKDRDEVEKPQRGRDKLEKLWSFGDAFTKGKNVSCMSWNRTNNDILAAGYGEYGVPGAGNQQSSAASKDAYKGFVCCWSLMNPVAPERVIKIESDAGVSALHFSNIHPSLLAVGNTDGTLALYDVRKHGNTPALRTSVAAGQHTGTIWEVKWVEKAKDRSGSENLVSISADGFVMEWSIKKGLEKTSAHLMKLKRQPKEEGASAFARNGGKEALLSRQSGGMCFDMNWEEPLTYVIGTEDGNVHRCTKSQAENFVLDYTPHAEPVYRIRWSPFNHEYFLTCSADWTSRLYHWETPNYIQKFDSNKQDAVHDICWSPRNCTVFGAATSQGVVDVWDLREPMQPNASLALKENKNVSLNCLLFAEQDAPLMTVGDSDGDVTVVKLNGSEFEGNGLDRDEQADRFTQVVQKLS